MNKMEAYSLIVVIITMYTGMFYVTGRHYDYMENEGLSWFFLIILALPNMVFFIYWFLKMRLEVLKMVRAKNKPKLFRIVSCCLENYDIFY